MSNTKYRIAIIGCGPDGTKPMPRAYTTYPDTEIIAIADANAERRQVLGARFNVPALYPDVETLLANNVPDIRRCCYTHKIYERCRPRLR